MNPLVKLKLHKIIKAANLDGSFKYVAVDRMSSEARVYAYVSKPVLRPISSMVIWDRDGADMQCQILKIIDSHTITIDDCKELIEL
jgi:hypothetical protein